MKRQNYCDSSCGVCKCCPQNWSHFSKDYAYNCKTFIQRLVSEDIEDIETLEAQMVSTCAADAWWLVSIPTEV